MGFKNFLIKSFGGSTSLSWKLNAGLWSYPDDNSDAYIQQGYDSLPNVYAIIDRIASKASSVPFRVYRIKDQAKYNRYKAMLKNAHGTKDLASTLALKNEALTVVEGSDIEKLLSKPNSYQSTTELFHSLDGYKLLTGNSYLWGIGSGVGKNGNKPMELHVPPSPMVKIKLGKNITDPIGGYKIEYYDKKVPEEDMAHFKIWNPLSSNANPEQFAYGMSPLMSCRKLMGRYCDADITQGSLFKNQAPQGILTGDGMSLTEQQAKSVKDSYTKMYGGKEKAGDIIVTSAKMSWQKIGLSPVDLNILEGKQEMLSELCNIYHVPVGLFSAKNSSENNIMEGRKALITDAVIPLIEARKAVLNRWLGRKFKTDEFIEFDYTVFHEIQEDLNVLVDSASRMWWISANEKRALTRYDPDPDPLMDRKYVPMGLQSMEDMAKRYEREQVNEDLLNQ